MKRGGAPQNWSHSKIFEDVGVALNNDITPTEFWSTWDKRDQALAIAHERATKTMQAWEQHLHEREMRRQNPPGRKLR